MPSSDGSSLARHGSVDGGAIATGALEAVSEAGGMEASTGASSTGVGSDETIAGLGCALAAQLAESPANKNAVRPSPTFGTSYRVYTT